MKMHNIILLVAVLGIGLGVQVLANGGDQRVTEGKYLVNLSRSPFTPRQGEKVAMLASFVDIQQNKLIAEDLIVKVRIAKLGGTGGREFLFEQKGIQVKGGILELSYTFTQSGLHEVFFDFAFASQPENMHEFPDFLLDVQKQATTSDSNNLLLLTIIAGLAVGSAGGFILGRMSKVSK